MFLKDLIDNKSIAIVGNSGCELGRGYGSEIDSHDLVCRMNNYVVHPAFTPDYGEKEDIWITNASCWKNLEKINVNKLICIARPTSTNFRQNVRELLKDKVDFLPLEVDEEITSVYKKYSPGMILRTTMISTGLYFLFWVKSILGSVPNDIYGINFFGYGSPMHYYSMHEDTTPCKGGIEKKIFEEYLR